MSADSATDLCALPKKQPRYLEHKVVNVKLESRHIYERVASLVQQFWLQ